MARIVSFLLASVALMPIQANAYHVDTSFLQSRGGHAGMIAVDDRSETCADLLNKGAYFAVHVGIGTPMTDGDTQQEFELVADTGSDSVIVTSCVCVKNKFCSANDKCFQGTSHSKTFALNEAPVKKGSDKKAPLAVAMTFGSGTVMSVIASDVVNVGLKTARMDDGVLLMVDRRMLNIQGEFQGILGLGPPGMKGKHAMPGGAAGAAGDGSQLNKGEDSSEEVVKGSPGEGKTYDPKLFMKQAGVERYTLCFNDAGKPGSMRMNVPEFKQPIPTIGSFHWGLGLHGISAGDGDKQSLFVCGKDDMKKGQTTPCGFIPDSGTTLLMGPKEHIVKMFSSLCGKWDRCKQANEQEKKKTPMHHTFQKLLYNCADWKTPEHGIGEVPSLFFHVGEAGQERKIELTSWSFITETKEEQYKHQVKYLFGAIPVDIPQRTGQTKDVCVPSFGVQVYNTKENGPVWIMGHPLFYQFNVGYSLGKHSGSGSTKDLEMAFIKHKCTACSASDDKGASLLTSDDDLEPASQTKRARTMRRTDVPPRVHFHDTSLPL